MSFFDKVNEICRLDEPACETDFNFSCIGNSGVAFEGKYKIESFDENQVTLNLGKGRFMKIEGEKLAIGTLAPKEIGISGKILTIKFEGKV